MCPVITHLQCNRRSWMMFQGGLRTLGNPHQAAQVSPQSGPWTLPQLLSHQVLRTEQGTRPGRQHHAGILSGLGESSGVSLGEPHPQYIVCDNIMFTHQPSISKQRNSITTIKCTAALTSKTKNSILEQDYKVENVQLGKTLDLF